MNNKPQRLFPLLMLLIVSVFLIPLLCTGCVKEELVNDPTTGEILPPKNTETYVDGHYYASTRYYDTRGYAQQLDIVVKNHIITQANFREISRSGADRLSLEGSDKTWDELSPYTLNSLYFRLYNGLILSQTPDEIDVVSGATQTSERFIKLSEAVVAQSMNGATDPIKLDTFDTYTVTGQTDPDGFQGTMTAAFNGSKLTSLTYDEIRPEDGKSKRRINDSTNTMNYGVLFDTYIHDTMTTQSLDPVPPENELPPEKMKYNECLRLLKEMRLPFGSS
jgi:major membrane immunogen (membrane-anchored lipoprotein)